MRLYPNYTGSGFNFLKGFKGSKKSFSLNIFFYLVIDELLLSYICLFYVSIKDEPLLNLMESGISLNL